MWVKGQQQLSVTILTLASLAACSGDDQAGEDHRRHSQPAPSTETSAEATHAGDAVPKDYAPVAASDERRQRFAIRTERAQRAKLVREVRTVGVVRTDETRESHVHMKWSGWIDEIFVNYVGQQVTKGARLFSVYSPDLLTAQQELIVAARRSGSPQRSAVDPGARSVDSLLETARAKLRLWEVADETIAEIERTGRVQKSITILSPQSGTVIAKTALSGMFVEPTMDLYTVADLSVLWVTGDIYEFEAPFIAVGQTAVFEPVGTAGSGSEYEAPVSFVSPIVDTVTRTIKIRLEIPNKDGRFRPGAYGVIRIKVPLPEAIVVSADSVIDTGTQKILFVDMGDGIFAPRSVRVGTRAQGFVQVLEGIDEGENIVTRGQFLLDSESRLQAVAESAGSVEHSGH